MTNKNDSYNSNFWLFLRQKALNFHKNSENSQVSEKLKETKVMENMANLSRDSDAA